MTSEPAGRIREAIFHENYTEAVRLWDAYSGQLAEAIRNRVITDAQMAEFDELFVWSRTVLLAARSQLQARYGALQAAAVYSSPLPPPLRRLIRTSF